jgi:hypothetical protein
LRAAQRQALECLMQGMGYVETASRVKIDRRTLYRWVNQDPEFHKALESWRAVAVRSAEDRLLRGIELAATRLSYAAARDYRAASILLKGRGLLPGVAPAPPPAAPGRPGAARRGDFASDDVVGQERRVLRAA